MSEKSEELYDKALQLLQSGNVTDGITTIEESLMEDAQDALSWRLYAVALTAAGRNDDATAAMVKAEGCGLDPVDTMLMKAAEAQIAGNLEGAISLFEDAIEHDDQRYEVWCAYALVLVEADYHQDALDAIEKAINHGGKDDAQVWYARGRIYRMMGDLKKALPAFDQSITLDSTAAIAHHERGMVQAELGGLEDAIRSFEQVLELIPGDPAASEALEVIKSQLP